MVIVLPFFDHSWADRVCSREITGTVLFGHCLEGLWVLAQVGYMPSPSSLHKCYLPHPCISAISLTVLWENWNGSSCTGEVQTYPQNQLHLFPAASVQCSPQLPHTNDPQCTAASVFMTSGSEQGISAGAHILLQADHTLLPSWDNLVLALYLKNKCQWNSSPSNPPGW